jgi:tetratricopeptide (TPR) repeat protein
LPILFFSVFFLLPVTGALRAQDALPWWYTMERGKLLFRSGEYGDALLVFEDARRQRRERYAALERQFIDFLARPEIRRLGDSLERLETWIAERNETTAAEALGELYYRYPKNSLDNSAVRALYQLGRLKEYPEAEYWIGETYRVEGELSLALIQYRRALEGRDILENPGFAVDLLSKIAGVRRVRQEYVEMENTLKGILEGIDAVTGRPRDTLWTGESSFARNAMRRTLENEGIDRFLVLYRYNNTLVEPAHRLLGLFYYASGRYNPGSALDHLMFAFLIQNTVILEEALKDRYDYTFTGLDDLMNRMTRNRLVSAYIEESEYYKTAYYLANVLYGEGKLAQARGVWEFIAGREDAGEWRGRAQRQLRSPIQERTVEMP